MQQVAEVTAVDRRAQLRKGQTLLSYAFRGVERGALHGIDPAREHMNTVCMGGWVGAVGSAGPPLSTANSGLLAQFALCRIEWIFAGFDDASGQFHHRPRRAMAILRNDANAVDAIEANDVRPIGIAQDVVRRNANAGGRRAIFRPKVEPAILDHGGPTAHRTWPATCCFHRWQATSFRFAHRSNW